MLSLVDNTIQFGEDADVKIKDDVGEEGDWTGQPLGGIQEEDEEDKGGSD